MNPRYSCPRLYTKIWIRRTCDDADYHNLIYMSSTMTSGPMRHRCVPPPEDGETILIHLFHYGGTESWLITGRMEQSL
ncbi:MAG: hypothetical protein ACLVEX_15185 [Ruthenibacterium lactatiformans]